VKEKNLSSKMLFKPDLLYSLFCQTVHILPWKMPKLTTLKIAGLNLVLLQAAKGFKFLGAA